MEYGRKWLEQSMRRRVAVILVFSLILGLLPLEGASVSRAGEGQGRTTSLENPRVSDGVTTWDCIYFGNYWQNDTNGDGKADQDDAKQPIKWRVLSVDGDDAFLMADNNLDCQKYNDADEDVTWETSTLRTWLNDSFLKQAFSYSERAAVKRTQVVNSDNPFYGTDGGSDTTDQVYLLSVYEAANVDYGFGATSESVAGRRSLNTAYAKEQGAYTAEEDYAGNGYWWLRSPGSNSRDAINVNFDGCVQMDGEYAYVNFTGVRPVLHLDLSSSSEWSMAGTTASDGTVMEPSPTPSEAPPTSGSAFPTFPTFPTASPRPSSTASPTPPMCVFPEFSATPGTYPSYAGVKNPRTSDGVTTWDCIYFGNYWQNDTNGDGAVDLDDDKEPIKWRVLSVDGNDAFLVADRNLDCQKYNNIDEEVTWETSTLRAWLNDTFLNKAFTLSEQSAVRNTKVINNDNPYYGTEGGSDTTDQVYLLSMEEAANADYGFSALYEEEAASRRALNTAYTAQQGAYTSSEAEYTGSGYWWLRSPGDDRDSAVSVDSAGNIASDGYYVIDEDVAVRPALHLDLSFVSEWSLAGTVASDGTVNEPGSSVSPSATPTFSTKPSYAGLKNPRVSDGVTTWDCIYFGNYWQKDTDGDGTADQNDDREPIKWRVLSVNGDDAFLVADKNLDCQVYNGTQEAVTWETSTLRAWLNDSFIKEAFSPLEQSAIKSTQVINNDNPNYGTEGGNDTIDQVYLLSIDEVTNKEYGFSGSYDECAENRSTQNTEYADEQGAFTSSKEGCTGNGYWWLRSPGKSSNYATHVGSDGSVFQYGFIVSSTSVGIRPALHLDFSSVSVWSLAGTVASDGTVNEPGSSASPSSTPTVFPTMPSNVPPSATPTSGTKPSYAGLKNPRVSDDVTTWDCLYFGNYWQNDTDEDYIADEFDDKEPIKWRVLSVNGDDAFLVADQSLDCQQYNKTDEVVTWETSTLREWLNDSFLDNAFSASEQFAIKYTRVPNGDNPLYGTEGGNDTIDQVYLLSIDEVMNTDYGFSASYNENAENRRTLNTAYTDDQGAYTSSDAEYEGNGFWWLRSPGRSGDNAAAVNYSGRVDQIGDSVIDSFDAVRPALHLNLSSVSTWSLAGTVASDGTVTEPAPAPTMSPGASITPTPPSTPGTNRTPAPPAMVTPGKPSTGSSGTGSSPNRYNPPISVPKVNSQKTHTGGEKEPTSQNKVTPGKIIMISGLQYKIKKSTKKEKTVAFWRVANKKVKKVNIPNAVKIQSASYKVVEISKNAFKGCKQLQTATMGKEVRVIGKGAFSGCKKIKRVIIRSKKLKKIGKGAFAGVSRKAKIQVPKSKVAQYRKLMKKG